MNYIHKNIDALKPIFTSHGVGEKIVLVSSLETSSNITQIAKTRLKTGNIIPEHCHPTMDEHFIILSGQCNVIIDKEAITCKSNSYVMIPSGIQHGIDVIEDTELITIGVEIK